SRCGDRDPRRRCTAIRAALGHAEQMAGPDERSGYSRTVTESVDLDSPTKLLIFVTDELDQLRIGHDLLVDPHGERLRVRLGVLERDVDRQAAEARACEPLSKSCVPRVRTTTHI